MSAKNILILEDRICGGESRDRSCIACASRLAGSGAMINKIQHAIVR